MTAFFYDSVVSFLESLFPGILIGALYDVFRILRIGARAIHSPLGKTYEKYMPGRMIKPCSVAPINQMVLFLKRTSLFAQDMIFWMIAVCVEILFIFYIYNGEIRVYSLIVAFLGFLLYLQSVGKFVMYFAKHIYLASRFIIAWILYAVTFPFVRAFRAGKVLMRYLYRITIFRWKSRRMARKLFVWSEKKKTELLLAALNGFE